jgi:hypothetical protein
MTQLQTLLGLQAVGGKDHLHVGLAQGSPQPQGYVGGVFYQQDAGLEGIH